MTKPSFRESLLDYALDVQEYFDCYPVEFEYCGVIYTFEQYAHLLPYHPTYNRTGYSE